MLKGCEAAGRARAGTHRVQGFHLILINNVVGKSTTIYIPYMWLKQTKWTVYYKRLSLPRAANEIKIVFSENYYGKE